MRPSLPQASKSMVQRSLSFILLMKRKAEEVMHDEKILEDYSKSDKSIGLREEKERKAKKKTTKEKSYQAEEKDRCPCGSIPEQGRL
jgi:hypothetical protein